MKKQRQRKQKEKAKQKKKAPEKLLVAPSTLGGTVGEMVDRYRRLTMKEYNDVVQLCQMHGVQLSKALLGRGKSKGVEDEWKVPHPYSRGGRE